MNHIGTWLRRYLPAEMASLLVLLGAWIVIALSGSIVATAIVPT